MFAMIRETIASTKVILLHPRSRRNDLPAEVAPTPFQDGLRLIAQGIHRSSR